MNNLTNTKRPETTPPEIELKELEWWKNFAELEEQFAWVQPPEMQKILRSKYVKEIIKITGGKGRILDLGCGAGWLSIALAKAGAKEVIGVDFSPAQINIARSRADKEGLTERLHFQCTDGTKGDPFIRTYDCVVIHGFLHHLSKSEIIQTIAGIPQILKPGGKLIIFEPILHITNNKFIISFWEKSLNKLSEFASRGHRWGIRIFSEEEACWRDLFARRNWGLPPHGPSPKEMPFQDGDLEYYLETYFSIESQKTCMVKSHLIVQEWLLRQLSHPRSTRMLLPFIALAATWLDSKLIASQKFSPGAWKFNMFICNPRGEL